MNSKTFSKRFTVTADAIDNMDHVNNLAYLQWCLDAAEAHWIKVANESLRDQFVWVVLKHEIEYRQAAFLNEELEIETWVSTATGLKSERNYRIRRLADQQLLVEAKTLWCLLDANSHRPTKIPEEIRNLFL